MAVDINGSCRRNPNLVEGGWRASKVENSPQLDTLRLLQELDTESTKEKRHKPL
jgi:hypothetical protein